MFLRALTLSILATSALNGYGLQGRHTKLLKTEFSVSKSFTHLDSKRLYSSTKAAIPSKPRTALPPGPDLESISWIAASQVALLLLGGLGISILPFSHPPTWKLDSETIFNVMLFAFPMSIGGLILDQMPGNTNHLQLNMNLQ